MKSQTLCSTLQGHTDKSMTSEQFAQVIEAILAGKYSWACLLILRFAGYNPLHYIPYRTFNRLLKENIPSRKEGKNQIDKSLNHYQVRNIKPKPQHRMLWIKFPILPIYTM